LLVSSNAIAGGPKKPAEKPDPALPVVSTFTLPSTLKEGRDPFYPESQRVHSKTQPKTPVVVSKGPATLELKGISGTPDRPLALINNQTFAEGDKQMVSTTQGKIRVECVDIKGTTVKIIAQGQTRELMLRRGI
jgi:hypothetical protein